MNPVRSLLIVSTFVGSVFLCSAALADLPSSPTSQNSSAGNKISTITKPDGTTITTLTEPNGTMIITIIQSDGTTIKTINQPDGTTVQVTTYLEGTTVTTTTTAEGTITTHTTNPSQTTTSSPSPSSSASPTAPVTDSSPAPTPDASSSPSPSPDASSSPTPTPDASSSPAPSPDASSTPTPTPSPTPPPSQPLPANFTIDQAPIYFTSDQDPTNLAMISATCITADQWAAFLNTIAKYSDKHGLYYPAMANPNPGLAQFKKTTAADGSFLYSVVNRDQSAGIATAPTLTFKDLPITYVNLCDAARFCNWLHHGQPALKQSDNPDDVTEGGAYLITDGLDTYWQSTHQKLPGYVDLYYSDLSKITPLSTALWRVPSYYNYNGMHDSSETPSGTPDYTEPGNDFYQQALPATDVNGLFDNHFNNALGISAPYEWTSTHLSNAAEAKQFHQDAANVGVYYQTKSPTDERQECAVVYFNSTTQSFTSSADKTSISKESDNHTSFRVMPLGAAIKPLPAPNPSVSPAPDAESTPDASATPTPGVSPDSTASSTEAAPEHSSN